MVRAILAGIKTQTRRIADPQPPEGFCLSEMGKPDWYPPIKTNPRTGESYPGKEVFGIADADWGQECKYGPPGSELWVRETFQHIHQRPDGQYRILDSMHRPGYGFVEYAATPQIETPPKWKPSTFMPRWASRISLITSRVRFERLQDISEEDAEAEGAMFWWNELSRREKEEYYGGGAGPLGAFKALWILINGEESWNANPYVWVLEWPKFERK